MSTDGVSGRLGVLFDGTSAAVAAIREDIEAAAACDATVMIAGEPGVGKQSASRLIHGWSARRLAPIVTLSCAGTSDAAIESQLFGGPEREAGGVAERLLDAACGGTMVIRHVDSLSASLQAALFDYLDGRVDPRAGLRRSAFPADPRLITLTAGDLLERVESGLFRDDLYYRLNVILIAVPPLRDRADDIPSLVAHFLQSARRQAGGGRIGIAPEALDILARYAWPGNFIELKQLSEQLAHTSAETVAAADLPAHVRASSSGADRTGRDAAGSSTSARTGWSMGAHGDAGPFHH